MSGNYHDTKKKSNHKARNSSNGGSRNQHSQSTPAAVVAPQKSLPCKKMICTGICSYRNRCHYIHDARIMSHAVKASCRKKDKEEKVEQKDLFFWPPLPAEDRMYSVPTSSFLQQSFTSSPKQGKISGPVAVASLWHHFVEVCVRVANKTDLADPPPEQRDAPLLNEVTRRPRLAVFVHLSLSGRDQQDKQQQQQQQHLLSVQGNTPPPIIHATRPSSPPAPTLSSSQTHRRQTLLLSPPNRVDATAMPSLEELSNPPPQQIKKGDSSLLYKYMPVGLRATTFTLPGLGCVSNNRRSNNIITSTEFCSGGSAVMAKKKQQQQQKGGPSSPSSSSCEDDERLRVLATSPTSVSFLSTSSYLSY
jgi:hypothetical protein